MRALSLRGSTIAVSLVAALVLAGCTSTGSSSSPPPGGGPDGAATTDTIRTTIDIPAGFDPAKGVSLPDFVLARQSYDTLVRRGSSGVVGGLATSWTSTPTSASLVLRADATCDDGTPITPTVAAGSLERYADPKTAASTTVTAFGPGNKPTIVADDEANTLEITVPAPWDLVGGLTLAATGITATRSRRGWAASRSSPGCGSTSPRTARCCCSR